jgi:hypothetical protein
LQNETLFFDEMTLPNKSIKIFLNRILGPALFVWLGSSIYKQIVHQPNLQESLGYIMDALIGPVAWKFWLVMVLMCANWLIEAHKWQVLMMPLKQISIWHSFKGTLAGVALGLNTPNRIGEYGGRMLYVEKGKRSKSISLTVIGSLSQLIVTLLVGGTGLFLQKINISSLAGSYTSSFAWMNILKWAVLMLSIMSTLFYFRLGWLVKCCGLLNLRGKWISHVHILQELDVTILLRVLALSACRYLVFVYQYILLLQIMHVNIGTIDAFWLISILYLILALAPTIAMLELGLRGEIAILLFGLYSENVLGIYAASTGIWFVNLILPALAGSLLVTSLKIFNVRQ